MAVQWPFAAARDAMGLVTPALLRCVSDAGLLKWQVGIAHCRHALVACRCAFIDFGNMMFSQPMYDVAFFMVHSLDVDTRRKHERAVVEHYHATLLANGVDPATYSLERCWKDYRFNFWWAPPAAQASAHSRLPHSLCPHPPMACIASCGCHRRAFISLLAMGPSVEHQHRTGTGIFAEHPTKADQQVQPGPASQLLVKFARCVFCPTCTHHGESVNSTIPSTRA